MNANDLIVRIERIAGGFNGRVRDAVVAKAQEFIDSAAKELTPKIVSQPLTDNEIHLFRESLRASIAPVDIQPIPAPVIEAKE